MKKHNILIVVLVLSVFFVIDSFGSLSYFNDSIEERIGKTIEKSSFSSVEFEDGYICIYSGSVSNEECLFLSYLKKELFGETGFNLRALVANDYNYYLNNTNFKKVYTLPLNNFSKHTIYFSCCESERAYPVEVNGEEVELYELEIRRETETYRRTFWFYLGEDDKLPTVKEHK